MNEPGGRWSHRLRLAPVVLLLLVGAHWLRQRERATRGASDLYAASLALCTCALGEAPPDDDAALARRFELHVQLSSVDDRPIAGCAQRAATLNAIAVAQGALTYHRAPEEVRASIDVTSALARRDWGVTALALAQHPETQRELAGQLAAALDRACTIARSEHAFADGNCPRGGGSLRGSWAPAPHVAFDADVGSAAAHASWSLRSAGGRLTVALTARPRAWLADADLEQRNWQQRELPDGGGETDPLDASGSVSADEIGWSTPEPRRLSVSPADPQHRLALLGDSSQVIATLPTPAGGRPRLGEFCWSTARRLRATLRDGDASWIVESDGTRVEATPLGEAKLLLGPLPICGGCAPSALVGTDRGLSVVGASGASVDVGAALSFEGCDPGAAGDGQHMQAAAACTSRAIVVVYAAAGRIVAQRLASGATHASPAKALAEPGDDGELLDPRAVSAGERVFVGWRRVAQGSRRVRVEYLESGDGGETWR